MGRFVSINGDYTYESVHLCVTYSVTSYQAVSLPGAICMKFRPEILSCCIGSEKPDDMTFTVCMLCLP